MTAVVRPIPTDVSPCPAASHHDEAIILTATQIIGRYSQITERLWAHDHGEWQFYEVLARASGIRTGTTEILPNILADRVLGLPED